MEQVRGMISKGSSLDQLQYEFKTLTKEDRQSLLDQAGIHDAIATISPNDVLAMKSDLSIPWNKFRTLRRYFQTSVDVVQQMDAFMEYQLEHRKQGESFGT